MNQVKIQKTLTVDDLYLMPYGLTEEGLRWWRGG